MIGQKELDAATCEALAEATAVLISISLSEGAEEQKIPKTPQEPLAPSGEEHSTASSIESSRGQKPSQWVASVGVRASVGIVPQLGIGPIARLSLEREALAIEIGVLVLLPAESRDEMARGGRFSSPAVWGGACRYFGSSFRAGGCAALVVGGIHASGLGVDESLSPWGLRLSPEARLPLQWGSKTFLAALVAHGGWNISRPSFVIDPYGTYFQPAPLYGGVSAELGWKF